MSKLNKKITIIMSTYNDQKYLNSSIKSILNQTYKNFIFMIIDDASTDNTKHILKYYKKKDSRIRIYYNTKNKGLTENLNFLLKKTRTKYVARMDADDISLPYRLKIQVNEMINNDIDILGSNCFYISNKNKTKIKSNLPLSKDKIYKDLERYNPIIHSSVIFKKKAISKIGNYDLKFKKCQDFDLWIRCKRNNLKIINLSKPLIMHREKNVKNIDIIFYVFRIVKSHLFKSISIHNAIIILFITIGSLVKFNLRRFI